MRPPARFLLAAALVGGALVAVPGEAAGTSRCGTHTWCNTSLTPDARAALLQKAMTQDEEIQLLGGDVQNQAPHTGKAFEIVVDRIEPERLRIRAQ